MKSKMRAKRHPVLQGADAVVANFLETIKQSADFVCSSCNRLLFRTNVLLLNEAKYTNTPKVLLDMVLAHRKISAKGREWICGTCHHALKGKRMPAQAKCNNLSPVEIPTELKDLNPLELRLICQRIPFMRMLGLPRGQQKSIHGPSVNVPSSVDAVCTVFPRLPSELQLIPLKLKRKMAYKKYYMYDNVHKEKVLNALRYLIEHNEKYAHIKINGDWENDCELDDADLWKALTTGEGDPDEMETEETPARETNELHICNDQSIPVVEHKQDSIFNDDQDHATLCIATAEGHEGGTDDLENKKAHAEEHIEMHICNDMPVPAIEPQNDSSFNDELDDITLCNAMTIGKGETFGMDSEKAPAEEPIDQDICNDEPVPVLEPTDVISRYDDPQLQRIAEYAHSKGLAIVQVPGDGDCLYHSVLVHFKASGIMGNDATPRDLRRKLAQHMRENSENYMGFVCAPVNHGADTERPTAEDQMINCIDDLQVQQQMRFMRFLDKIENGSLWGEHIAVQGLADLFSMTIHIIKSDWNDMNPVAPANGNSEREIHLGLINQTHYVALKKVSTPQADRRREEKMPDRIRKRINTQANERQEDGMSEMKKKRLSNDEVEELQRIREEREMAEDDAALEKRMETCGLYLETALFDETNMEMSMAPAENEKPRPLLTDPDFEALSNPHFYPDGKNTLTESRPVKLHHRKYFNARILDCDGRFAKSPEYLFSAQYATESNQVNTDINNYIFRKTTTRQFGGETINAGFLKDPDRIKRLVKSDVAFKCLKQVRGSPAYFQSMLYDITAMVRQLGVPTWFCTFTSADMLWPDGIQTIARQYGKHFTDEEVRQMPSKERFQWLRTNPVTAARHFDLRLQKFITEVIKSKAHPIGEVVDYCLCVEFQQRGSPHAHCLIWVRNAPNLMKKL
jgi:hypothetical protein